MGLFDFIKKGNGKNDSKGASPAPFEPAEAEEASKQTASSENALPASYESEGTSTVDDEAFLNNLRALSRQMLPSNLKSIDAQKHILKTMSETVSTIASLEINASHRYWMPIENGSAEPEKILAVIGVDCDKFLGITTEEAIDSSLTSCDNKRLILVFGITDLFSRILKPEYCVHLLSVRDKITNILCRRGMKIEARKASRLEALQSRCVHLTSLKDKNLEKELTETKKELCKELSELSEIYAAYDEDYGKGFVFVTLTGSMELFTKEEYAQKARDFFQKSCEGNFSVKKIKNEEFDTFFSGALHLGFNMFNLDNGIMNVSLPTAFMSGSKKRTHLVDDCNSLIRSCLIRRLQASARFRKMPEGEKKQSLEPYYKNILSRLASSGYTSMCNAVLYVLTDGECVEKTSLYTNNAYTKLTSMLKDKKDMSPLLCEGDNKIGTIGGIRGLRYITLGSKGNYLCMFTDRNEAEAVRKKHLDGGISLNVIGMNFDEILPHALKTHGIVIDVSSYGYIIEKAELEEIKRQMDSSKKKNNPS